MAQSIGLIGYDGCYEARLCLSSGGAADHCVHDHRQACNRQAHHHRYRSRRRPSRLRRNPAAQPQSLQRLHQPRCGPSFVVKFSQIARRHRTTAPPCVRAAIWLHPVLPAAH
jgi:hypothetical protein